MFAAVFPGQGSQRPGMGKEFFHEFVEAQEVFRRVTEATGVDVQKLCFDTDESTLRQTQNAQLALFTVGTAAWRCLKVRLGGRALPEAMAGHSVGEYAALAAAGVVSIEDGARLVQKRGDLMARSGNQRKGTMAAVLGMERVALEAICHEASNSEGVVVVANDNCPGQLVISGDVDAVQRASTMAQDGGAKRVLPLSVSGAFHSPLMKEAAQALGESLHRTTFGTEPGTPLVYANVTAQPVNLASAWPVLLETQLKMPVRWAETIRNMAKEGISTFVECGAGEVLSGLIRRIHPEARTLIVGDPASLENSVKAIREVEAVA